jgi:hypothetical protein
MVKDKKQFEIRVTVPENVNDMANEIADYYQKNKGSLCYPCIAHFVKSEYEKLKDEIKKEKL